MAFRIDRRVGTLTHLNTIDAGIDPAHLSTDEAGRFLLAAYYVAAKVTVHAIEGSGQLRPEPIQTVPTGEKAHAIVLDRDNRFAFVPHTRRCLKTTRRRKAWAASAAIDCIGSHLQSACDQGFYRLPMPDWISR
jgi:6-phosphogluconolactonase (cycloisomerase 2 family)